MYPSIYNNFPVIRTTIAKNRHFYVPRPSFLFALGMPEESETRSSAIAERPLDHAKHCMNKKTIQCLPSPSQHVPIYLQHCFPVIRTASANNRHFHVPKTTFLFPLETPLRLSRNMLHGWKGNSMLAKRLAASTYLSIIVSELYDA